MKFVYSLALRASGPWALRQSGRNARRFGSVSQTLTTEAAAGRFSQVVSILGSTSPEELNSSLGGLDAPSTLSALLSSSAGNTSQRQLLAGALIDRIACLSWENKAVLLRGLQAEGARRGRMQRASLHTAAAVLCGTTGPGLTALKEAVNVGNGSHDLDALVFRQLLRSPAQQAQVLQHFALDAAATYAPGALSRPLQVVSDFDDTLQANWLDKRLPRGSMYPGALQFLTEVRATAPATHQVPAPVGWDAPAAWSALQGSKSLGDEGSSGDSEGEEEGEAMWGVREQVAQDLGTPEGGAGGLLVLTARPGGVRNLVKSRTLQHLTRMGLAPVSVMTGSMLHLRSLAAIGERKLDNLHRFMALFPEMDAVLLGDSGQADAAFMAGAVAHYGPRVRAAFLHNVTPASSTTGDGGSKAEYQAQHGISLFGTYAGAATSALHSGLLTAPAALRVAAAAVAEFEAQAASPPPRAAMRTLTRLAPKAAAAVQRVAALGRVGLPQRSARWQGRFTAYGEELERDVTALADAVEGR